MTKNKLFPKILLYIPIIFFFLPAFYFYIPGIKLMCSFFQLSLFLVFGILALNYKASLARIKSVIKHTPLKYFVLALVLMIINSFLHSLFGSYLSIYSCIRIIVLRIGLVLLPILLFMICVPDKYISYKNFVKTFIFLFWLMLIIGFVAYLGQLLDISVLNSIFDFFANKRILSCAVGSAEALYGMSNYEAFGLPRLDGLFEEPGQYAQFLFLFLPMVYSFSSSKIKLCKNQALNTFIKLSLIPFTWINIILTMSPIFLCLSGLITFIFFFKQILFFIRRYFLILTITFLLVFSFILSNSTFGSFDFSETYLSRIINIITNCRSFDDLISIEPSLAARLCSYINTFCVFKQHIFFGVGFGNIEYALFFQYAQSPVNLTKDLLYLNNAISATGKATVTENIITGLLAENGIFIFSIFAYFIYQILSNINKTYKFFLKLNFQFEYTCARFLKYSLIAVILNSFYNMAFLNNNLYMIIGLSLMLIYRSKSLYKVKSDKNNESTVQKEIYDKE